MSVRCRNNLNGLNIQTTSSTTTLTELLMQTSSMSRYFRLEARISSTRCGVPEFQIGLLSNPTLLVGDNYTYAPRPFVVGTQATANTMPSNTLTVNGTLACSGQMIGKMFFCAGKINADGAKAFTSLSGLTDFTCTGSNHQITFGTSHPAGTNYVTQVTAQGAIGNVSTNTLTANSFTVVTYSAAATWPNAATAQLFFIVLH